MRTLLTFIYTAALIVATLVAAVIATKSHAETIQMPCIARYFPLSPTEAVGTDGCGHIWKLVLPESALDRKNAERAGVDKSMGVARGDSAECFYWNTEGGEYFPIPCPAQGDTTAVIEVELQ